MSGRRLLLAFAVLLAALVATSRPARVGDGREYLAVALNLAYLDPPALSEFEIAGAEGRLERWGFGGLPLAEHPELTDASGRQDFFHFWLYPALAAPLVRLALAARTHPNYGFVALNVLLFLAALWVVSRRVAWWLTAALFCGPILWWIDKAHTEVFTFSLLAIAFAVMRDAPWWSMVCLATAATQNPPIAAVALAVGLAAPLLRPGAWRDHRFQAGAVATLAIALLHPLYYWWRWRLATPQLVLGTAPHVPTVQELGTVLWEPNMGLLFHAPLLAGTMLVAAVVVGRSAWRRLVETEGCLALLAAAIFLVSFSQTTNVNSGATPGMSRYALWLLPLSLPIMHRATTVGATSSRPWLPVLALASCLWSIALFHPRQPERYCAPSRAAQLLWTRWPSFDNPLPEIFAERVSGEEPGVVPVAVDGCRKALLREGQWPAPCRPRPVPPSCSAPGALCYANASGGGYDFVPVASPARYDFAVTR